MNVGKKAADGMVELVTRATLQSEDVRLETAAQNCWSGLPWQCLRLCPVRLAG